MANRVIHRTSSQTTLPKTYNPKYVQYAVAWDEGELLETSEKIAKPIFELKRSDSNGNYSNWTLIKLCSSVEQAELIAEQECQRKLIWK